MSEGEKVTRCTDQFRFQHRKGRNTRDGVGMGTEININLIDLDLNYSTCIHETNPQGEVPCKRNFLAK